jgi:DNA-binding NtrC family response regulator
MLIRVATRTLQRLGYRVTAFQRPADALEAFAADPVRFDAVITDMNMPETDGLSVARAVHKIRSDVPVVLVSGSIDEALRVAAVDAGIFGMLAKPFTIQELSETVARLPIHHEEPKP